MSKCRNKYKTTSRDVTPRNFGAMYWLHLQRRLNTVATHFHFQERSTKTLRNADSYAYGVRSHKTIILTAAAALISNPASAKVRDVTTGSFKKTIHLETHFRLSLCDKEYTSSAILWVCSLITSEKKKAIFMELVRSFGSNSTFIIRSPHQ
jgi:hypothetical protein